MYSGPIDAYFGFPYGKLPWRSLDISFKEFKEAYKQPCVQINYPNDHPYTRSVEIKHVTKQESDNTVISYEVPTWEGDPYYPVPADDNAALFKKYWELGGKREHKITKCISRVGWRVYTYINTDEAIEMALETAEQIIQDAER